ncbi:MAG: hypothetical protein PHH71_03575 [Clostridia bacterium]|jgi:hypothetical protein|nr:hypothetical protein [Clostridia bacterium]MDD3231945.1 hypothetical protein [Clostridia bacterium]
MKYLFSYLLICGLFFTWMFAAIIPYPIFSDIGTLTKEQQAFLNDVNESEKTLTVETPPLLSAVSLDWFDTVNIIFEKYKNTRIIDVETGIQYFVQRTGGYNHADVEPIDIENMQKFNDIYNNQWSWDRRPVWVEINNMWVAASINGMPHGYSLISGNGQNGHTCIHFSQSKTHGTKNVDASHQNAVKYAFNNGHKLNELQL